MTFVARGATETAAAKLPDGAADFEHPSLFTEASNLHELEFESESGQKCNKL